MKLISLVLLYSLPRRARLMWTDEVDVVTDLRDEGTADARDWNKRSDQGGRCSHI